MADTTQQIVIKIKAESTKATNDIQKLNKQIDSLQKQVGKSNKSMVTTTNSVNKMGASFKTLGQHLARVAIYYGSLQAITGVVTTFATFEQSIKTLGVVSGSTEAELGKLSDKAKELGESTVFSASQVADGMIEMGRAGLSAQQQLDGVEGVLNLATVGNIELAEASKATTGAMHGFGLEASDMAMISDVMAKASNDSAQTVSQLAEAFSKVAPVAKDFGNSLIDTTGLLEVLADNNLKGALAGTQLKISMLRLSANVEVQKYLKDLSDATGGMDTSMYNADGTAKKFTEQLQTLKDATAGLDEQSRNTHLARIFGSEAITGAKVMMNNLDKVQMKMDALNKSYGYASESAREMMDTLKGSYAELMAAIEGLAIRIGDKLAPTLKGLTDDMADFITNIDDKELEKFAKAIEGVIDSIGYFGRAVTDVVTTLFSWVNAIQEFTGANNEQIVVLGLLIYNLDKLKKVVTLLGSAFNLALGGVLILITSVIIKLNYLKAEINELGEDTAKWADNTARYVAVWENTRGLKEAGKTLKDVRENLKELNKLLDEGEDTIRHYENKIRDLEGGLLPLTDSEKTLIEAYKVKIGSIQRMILTNKDYIEENKKAGIALTKSRLQEIADLNALANAHDKLSEKALKLSDNQLKAVEKTKQGYKDRLVTLEKTLGTMKTKEEKLNNDLIKLSQKLADTRKKHADERVMYENTFNSKIANIRASGLSELQQYRDAQRRADEELALAKKAIEEGNFAIAKQHYDEYNRLIQVNATNEIKENKKVVRSKKAGINELVKDTKAGHDVGLALLNEKQRKEEQAILNQIALKEAEIEMAGLQIKLQVQAIELMGKMISKLTGVKWDEHLGKAKAEIEKIETKIDGLFKEQRGLKIKGTFDDNGVKTGLAKTKQEADKTVIKPKTEVETDEAQGGFTKFIKENTNTGLIVDVLAEADKAYNELHGLEDAVEKPVTKVIDATTKPAEQKEFVFVENVENKPVMKKIDADIRPAVLKDNKLNSQISKTVTKTVVVNYRTVGKPQGLQTGGMVLPRFADGGHLDNGIGHSRKTGALSGYGGGDKIKALLEAGEFIIRKEAVKALGLDRLNLLNQGMLPRFNTGGVVDQHIPKFASGGSVSKTIPSKTVNVNMNIGGKTFNMISDEEVANSLATYLERSTF